MPEYRVSYSLLYDLAAVGRAASVTYRDHPEDVAAVEDVDDIESDNVPAPFSAVSDAMISEIIDDERALAGMLAGSRGYAQNVKTANDEAGVVFIPEDDVKAYIRALDDLASRVSLDEAANTRLREAVENIVQQFSQPLHPTDGTVVMNPESFGALDTILSDAVLELAFSDPRLDED